ncbi:Piso0_002209 [Millerozyma farinosa CBS 7064]|uniref:Piso0_002209 protein n=1 Tax=Pichia sorbitophila (strain ATCC MYA-4447 / BCRC 22081 / CBS 7064 / NBRC 10061 / NRRL Y-12695) TaxID=559304 RepID=G8YC01_PICSO|nr:Piso0_002209 [Millerozyma farinosa CBS 7064]
MSSTPHSVAIHSFNSNHAVYDEHRLSYSPKITEKFLIDLKLTKVSEGSLKTDTNKKILELASGTGKFTESLTKYGWSDTLTVVEPSEGMIETFQENFPHIEAKQGSSYDIPVPDNSYDAVIIAQGFHWFSDNMSLKEINRVLKPGGMFGCIWNFDAPSGAITIAPADPEVEIIYDDTHKNVKAADVPQLVDSYFETHPWSVATANFTYSYDVNVPQYRHGKWRDALRKDKTYFRPISKENFYLYTTTIKHDHVPRYWGTRSYITKLNAQERAEYESKLSSLVDETVTESDKSIENDTAYLKKAVGTHTIVLEVNK